MNKHVWTCVAPTGGYFRWACKNCPEMRPYPSDSNFDGECKGTSPQPDPRADLLPMVREIQTLWGITVSKSLEVQAIDLLLGSVRRK